MRHQKMSTTTMIRHDGLFRTFFSLWMAFSYLGLALFYPATCNPSGIHDDYIPSYRYTSAYTEDAALAQAIALTNDFWDEVGANPEMTRYITSDASSNASWLLQSRLPTTNAQFFVIDLVAVATLSHTWVNDSPVVLSHRFWQSQFQHQFKDSPPDHPPKFLG